MTAYYLFSSLVDRITDFFIHWYADGFRMWGHSLISFMEAVDRRLAFKITIKHLFQPLYQDRSFIGYILGFIFRCGRLIIGTVIYAIILIIAILIYLAWVTVPIYVIYKITEGLIAYY